MGYDADMKSGRVMVPAYRADIIHPYDVIEDVAISYGLNNLVPEVPRMATVGGPNPEEVFALKLKDIMVGLGFQEMVNLSLSNDKRQFVNMNIRNPGAVEIDNPISGEYSICRHWIIPTLLENLSSNIHRRYPQRIFELAECVHPDPQTDTRTRNVRKLGCAVSHAGGGFSEIMSAFRAFNEVIPFDLTISESKHSSFIPGRCAAISLGKDVLGHLGEIHPKVLTAFGLKMPVAAFEIDTERLWQALTAKK
jgi:phenylalanyl-tRNA synthetase beta chain